VIVNPVSGRGARPAEAERRIRLASDEIARLGGIPDVHLTERPGHAHELAQAAVKAGASVAIAWGGDGTVNEVASALAFTTTALGIVPAGSGNGLAGELGIDRSPAAAIRGAMTAPVRHIDLGEIGGRLFVNVAGIGFDAVVAERFARARWRGLSGYVARAAVELGRYRAPVYTLEFGADRRRVRALLIGIANSRQYGNGAIIAPGARLDDGRLDLVVVGARSMPGVVRDLPLLFRGRIAEAADVWVEQVSEVRIASAAPLHCHADGEPLEASADVCVRIHPGALAVRVPNSPVRGQTRV
jgi:YegS/Rv2252/BmrU family lipid kinase